MLPKMLEEFGEVDVFFHDSLHTYEHMIYEYQTAWPYLSPAGLILSDDIFWSRAFHEFCKNKGRQYVNIRGFGAVRK